MDMTNMGILGLLPMPFFLGPPLPMCMNITWAVGMSPNIPLLNPAPSQSGNSGNSGNSDDTTTLASNS